MQAYEHTISSLTLEVWEECSHDKQKNIVSGDTHFPITVYYLVTFPVRP